MSRKLLMRATTSTHQPPAQPNKPFFFLALPESPKIASKVLLASTLWVLPFLSLTGWPSGLTPAGIGSASRPTLMNEARLLAVLIGLPLRLPGARRPGPGDGARRGERGGGLMLLSLSAPAIETLRVGAREAGAGAGAFAASCSWRAELRIGFERVQFSAICQQWLRR